VHETRYINRRLYLFTFFTSKQCKRYNIGARKVNPASKVTRFSDGKVAEVFIVQRYCVVRFVVRVNCYLYISEFNSQSRTFSLTVSLLYFSFHCYCFITLTFFTLT